MSLPGIDVRIAFQGRLPEQVRAAVTRVRPALRHGLQQVLLDISARARVRVSGEVLRVRSGLLRNSAFTQVADTAAGAEGAVGFRAVYARYHEFGTRPYTIRPRSKRWLRFMGRDGRPVFTKLVRHPGLRPRPFLGPSIEDVRPTVQGRLAQVVLDAVGQGGAAR